MKPEKVRRINPRTTAPTPRPANRSHTKNQEEKQPYEQPIVTVGDEDPYRAAQPPSLYPDG